MEENLAKISMWPVKTDMSDRTMLEFKYDFKGNKNLLGRAHCFLMLILRLTLILWQHQLMHLN